MTTTGRPRVHLSTAEKQKAYRERQKALRNSAVNNPVEIVEPTALRNSSGNILDELKAEVDRLAALSTQHRMSKTYPDFGWFGGYDAFFALSESELNAAGLAWSRKATELNDQWWSAHQRWWDEKRNHDHV
jgi:hypothetical protein